MTSLTMLREKPPMPASTSGSDTLRHAWLKDSEFVTLLRLSLANTIDLELRNRHALWNARGTQFYSLHKMFEEFGEDLRSIADELGGRLGVLGVGVPGTISQIAALSMLPTYPVSARQPEDHIKALIVGYRVATRNADQSLKAASRRQDVASVEILTGLLRLLAEQQAYLKALTSQ